MYMKSVNAVPGLEEHTIERANLYANVIDLYREGNIVGEYPIKIQFLDEIAVDYGGLQRDMFACYLALVRLCQEMCFLTLFWIISVVQRGPSLKMLLYILQKPIILARRLNEYPFYIWLPYIAYTFHFSMFD